MPGSTLERNLEDLCQGYDLALSREQIEKMARLDALVEDWSSAVRLTGFSTRKERFERYFAEALHGSPAFPAKGTALDIGSGGGTPALPLAIARPAIQWILLEPNKRKAVFLEEAKSALGLFNVEVRRQRYEDFEGTRPMDGITSRGLSVDDTLLKFAWHGLERRCGLHLWTSRILADEIASRCGPGWRVRRKEPLAPRYESWFLVLERLEAPQ